MWCSRSIVVWCLVVNAAVVAVVVWCVGQLHHTHTCGKSKAAAPLTVRRPTTRRAMSKFAAGRSFNQRETSSFYFLSKNCIFSPFLCFFPALETTVIGVWCATGDFTTRSIYTAIAALLCLPLSLYLSLSLSFC